jgi:hypothetical protein
MRQALTAIAVAFTVALALVGAAWATPDDCSINPLVVDDGPAGEKALMVADGYNCPAVVLEIRSNLDITTVNPQIRAASVLIETAGDPDDPAQRVQLVNNQSASTLQISAAAGNIVLLGATVKAHKTMRFTCDAPDCRFDAERSDIITATDFNHPSTGGVLLFDIDGPINIQTTNVHGGDALEMESKSASITLICVKGDTSCKDPTGATPPDVIVAACGNPIVYPCKPVFESAADLKSVCIGLPGVTCNGGHKEKRFTAFTFIDITGGTITSDEHVTFTCKTGEFKGNDSVLEGESVIIRCAGKVNLQRARITAPASVAITSGTACAIGALCIDARGDADPARTTMITGKPIIMTARGSQSILDVCAVNFTVPGTGKPKLNSDSAPPYSPNVLDTGTECAPLPAASFRN